MRTSGKLLCVCGAAVLLLLGTAFGRWLYSNPQVPQGGSASFASTGTDQPANSMTWDVVNPSHTVIATSSAANGWTVALSGSTFTVGAPSSATAQSGYEVRYRTGSGVGGTSGGSGLELTLGRGPSGALDPAAFVFSYYSAAFDVYGPPAAPTNLTASAGNAQVTLSWTASTGATSYKVKRSTTSGSGYTTVASGVTSTGYTDTGLSNGTTYYYVVTAVNGAGESGNSNQASATPTGSPNPPTNLTATGGNTQVSLSWTASTGATSYNVKRSTTSGSGYATVASGVTSTSYTDTGLTNGTTYYYVVTAVNAGGESGNSNQAAATPEPPAPAAPTNLAGTPGNATVALTWTASSGATSYNVLRSTTSGSGYVTVKTGLTTTNWTDSGLTNWQTYYYVVTAQNGGGTSPYSNEAAVLLNAVPAAPTGLVGFGGDHFASLAWNPSQGATSYTVYYAPPNPSGGAGTFTVFASGLTSVNYLATGLTDDMPAFFRVTATNSIGEGPPSSQIMVTPTASTGSFSMSSVSETLAHAITVTGTTHAAPSSGTYYSYPNYQSDPNTYYYTVWTESFDITADNALTDAIVIPQGATTYTASLQDVLGPGQPTFSLTGFAITADGQTFQMPSPTSGTQARFCLVCNFSSTTKFHSWYLDSYGNRVYYENLIGSSTYTWIPERKDLNIQRVDMDVTSLDSRRVYGQPMIAGEPVGDPNAPNRNAFFYGDTYKGGLFVGFAPSASQDHSGTCRMETFAKTTPTFVNPLLSDFVIIDNGPSGPFGTSISIAAAIPAANDPFLGISVGQANWANAWSLANATSQPAITAGPSTIGTYLNVPIASYQPKLIISLANEALIVAGTTGYWRYFVSPAWALQSGAYSQADAQPHCWIVDQTYGRP